jgi:DNA (cytosine-5)-methyltransferase 1
MSQEYGFYEFFAGGGLARVGLGEGWSCLFANEICEKKAHAYRLNFGPSPELRVDDIKNLSVSDLPPGALLSWASFPCQDLSLAGKGIGLVGGRSGTFWKFWELMNGLESRGNPVPLIVIENVVGLISANSGTDFRQLIEAVTQTGYRIGGLVVDAVRFVPQSRPRLFLIAVAPGVSIPSDLVSDSPSDHWHNDRLQRAIRDLPRHLQTNWLWWRLPAPVRRTQTLTDLLLEDSQVSNWHDRAQTDKLLGMMSGTNRLKVLKAQAYGKRIAGTIYKRIRVDRDGIKVQRAEVRFDQVSGCLRTPTGGSSRQLVIVVEGRNIRTRLLDPREAARLMGVPDDYALPTKYNEAYHVMGDGLAVPAVSWIEQNLLWPLLPEFSERSARVA